MSENREPTTEEWFGHVIVQRQAAKDAMETMPRELRWGEYTDRYEAAIEDLDHAIRRACNRLRRIARDAKNRAAAHDEGAAP